jgi:superfamily II DNA or RNA helicase
VSFLDLKLKHDYDSEEDDILHDFYIPILSKAKKYHRLAGFFSSSALAVAAKGMSAFIKNQGRMQLVIGARLQKRDVEAIREGLEEPEKVIAQIMIEELEEIEEKFVRDHVKALAWLVANNQLDMKVAIVTDNYGQPLDYDSALRQGIFHQKVGVFEDEEGNFVSFSGSVNESATAWEDNIEEFKVFRSWIEAEKGYFDADLSKFRRFWEGKATRTKVVDMPKAIKEKLIDIAPNNVEELNLDKWVRGGKGAMTVELREYQNEAVQSWLSNDKRGIFEMATGTGKTAAALSCLKKTLETEGRIVVVISSPFIHLSEQWIRESDKLDVKSGKVLADSSQARWKDKMVDGILDVENGISDIFIVLTTHNTFSSPDFMNIIKTSKKRAPQLRLLLIVDEVHGIGAPERRNGLVEEYDYRLGLSATPKRWFDYEGTDKIFQYFGDVVFEFSLKDAIEEGYLTPYVYKPSFTSLTPEEMEKYEEETRKVSRAYYRSKDENEKDEIFTLLCIRRQKIIRNAMNKLVVFREILKELNGIKHCLIYCSPRQIRTVQEILNQRNIIQHKFTEKEGTKPEDRFDGLSERDYLIRQFSEGIYRVLVSMRCLDEGVDVPPARLAIMLDNSGNPREYIQRRGRVLRKYQGKERATIYDVIVEPIVRSSVPQELRDIERKIISKELERYRDFARSAENADECLKIMENVEIMYGLGQ